VLLGIDREKAARFSFLMVVPVILGKMLLDVVDMTSNPESASDTMLMPLMVGFVSCIHHGTVGVPNHDSAGEACEAQVLCLLLLRGGGHCESVDGASLIIPSTLDEARAGFWISVDKPLGWTSF